MLIKNIDLTSNTGQRVRIDKCSKRMLEGRTGTITTPFGEHYKGYIGIFLDVPLGDMDIINLIPTDEVTFIK